MPATPRHDTLYVMTDKDRNTSSPPDRYWNRTLDYLIEETGAIGGSILNLTPAASILRNVDGASRIAHYDLRRNRIF